MKLESPAFSEGERIPQKYTCLGEDINPPLNISHIPEDAKSLALIIDDPDAPVGTFVHWVVWNIPVADEISENSVPAKAVQGTNDFGKKSYGGPCPPSGTHTYHFKMYALDSMLDAPENGRKTDLLDAMEGHIIESAELTGTFSK